MDRGTDPHPAALAPVPAYPRRAVEQYLADARQAWDGLQLALHEAEARRAAAQEALSVADESHRLLGSMMVEAQQDLAARRAHAEEAAATMLANADAEAERILSQARAQATGLLGATSVTDADDDDEQQWPPPPARRADRSVGEPASAPRLAGSVEDAPDHAVAAVDIGDPVGELWPDRRPASLPFDALRWRPRWRRPHEGEWPTVDSQPDESYFSRLRDEMRADGTINAWFEPA